MRNKNKIGRQICDVIFFIKKSSSWTKLRNNISQNDVFYTNQKFQSQSINVYKYFQANSNNNNNNNNIKI